MMLWGGKSLRWCTAVLVRCALILPQLADSGVSRSAYIANVVFGKCGVGPTSNRFQRAWILDDLLQHCRKEVTCVQELLEAHRTNNSEFVSKYTSPGSSYFVQLDAENPNSWYMSDLQQLFRERRIDQGALKLIHLADNKVPPHGLSYNTFYTKWAQVLRNYWWEEPSFQDMFQRGSLKWFPLGYSNHIKKRDVLVGLTVLTPPFRNQTMFFLGNKRSGNLKREKNLEEIRRDSSIKVSGDVNKGNFGAGSHDFYVRGLLNSKFCLQLPGRFAECYRLYDSLELGCIPVFIDTFRNSNYSANISESLLRLKDISWRNVNGELTSALPLLRFDNVQSMDFGLKTLLRDEQKLSVVFQDCKIWWDTVKDFFRLTFRDSICVG